MPLIDLVALWQSYGNILWEPGQHKDTCKAYVEELQEIAVRNRLVAIDNAMLDAMISELRGKGNRNSTINRKMACLSKLLRKHQRNGGIDRLPDFAKLPEKNGRIRFLSRDEEGLSVRLPRRAGSGLWCARPLSNRHRRTDRRGLVPHLGRLQ